MKALFIGLLGLLGCPLALAQHFEFHPAGTDDAALDNALPTLARQVAAAYSDPNQERYLANLFPPEWADRIKRISTQREKMRRDGASMDEVAAETNALIDKEGWLPPGN